MSRNIVLGMAIILILVLQPQVPYACGPGCEPLEWNIKTPKDGSSYTIFSSVSGDGDALDKAHPYVIEVRAAKDGLILNSNNGVSIGDEMTCCTWSNKVDPPQGSWSAEKANYVLLVDGEEVQSVGIQFVIP